MKKFTLLLQFAVMCIIINAQIPQGFNYQAIVRNTSGEVLQNKTLRVTVSIKTALTGGIVLWEEYHDVTSNQFGLVSFAVGSGTYVSGIVTSFNRIDWKDQPLFLKTTVEYPVGTVTDMGTAQILSVPYSLVAKDVEGPIKKLDIKGTEASLDSALFEVKNKQGQTIFAVYNEGVRIYVDDGAKGAKGGFAVGGFDMAKGTKQTFLAISDDSVKIYIDSNPLTKKPKGGFAVGGYDMAKGTIQNYIDVNADSIRMYIDKNAKSKKGGFAVGSFDMAKGGKDHFLDVATDASGKIVPPQNRILWYPLKNAFLTGRIRIGTPDSVGENSFASGYESKAKGKYSQALGFKAISNGDYSTAIGKFAFANNLNSFAFGDSARATNNDSYAIGHQAVASGTGSFAFGSIGKDYLNVKTNNVLAQGAYSFAIGQGAQSIGYGSFSIGIASTTTGNYSVALGNKSSANHEFSTAIGLSSVAGGDYSTAIGFVAQALNDASIALGFNTEANGLGSASIGYRTKSNGEYSTAMGFQTNANGNLSTSFGNETIASGNSSTAMGGYTSAGNTCSTALGYHTVANGSMSLASGYYSIASGEFSTTMGVYTKALPYASLAIGRYNYETGNTTSWVDNDPLFICGNGSDASHLSNAFTVYKKGDVNVQHNLMVGSLDLNNYRLDVSGGVNAGGWITFNSTNRMGIGMIYSLPNNDDGAYCGWLNSGLGHSAGTLALIPRSVLDCDISFYTGNGIPTEKMTILSNGNVGIGTTNPGYKFQVGNAGDGTQARANAWNNLSDANLKTGFTRPDNSLGMINKINGYYFFWNTGSDKSRQFGFSAQEVEKVLPEVVSKGEDGLLSLDYGKVTPLLVEAIKDQQHQIESQQKEIDDLKSLVTSLIANQTAHIK